MKLQTAVFLLLATLSTSWIQPVDTRPLPATASSRHQISSVMHLSKRETDTADEASGATGGMNPPIVEEDEDDDKGSSTSGSSSSSPADDTHDDSSVM